MDVLVGLFIIATAGSAIIAGLWGALQANKISNYHVNANIVAKSQMEYVKSRPYSNGEWAYTLTPSNRSSSQQPSWWDAANPPLLTSRYEGFNVITQAVNFDADSDGTVEVTGDDANIRKVTVRVDYTGAKENPVLVLIDYEVDR